MELRFLLAALRRNRWIIALLLVVGVVLGGALGVMSPHRYRARASLLVSPQSSTTPGSQTFEDPDRFVAAQIDILESDALAARVVEAMPGETITGIEKAVSVSQRGKSDVIDVYATAGSATRAADLANAVVQAYTTDHASSVRALQQQSTALDNQMTAVQQHLTTVEANLAAEPRSGPDLAAQTALGKQYDQLLTEKTQLDTVIQLQSTGISFFDRAIPPPGPEARHTVVKILAGGVAGLAVGAVIAVLDAAWRPRVADREEVEELLGCPVRADLPEEPRLSRDGIQVDRHPGSRFAEEIRKVCVFAESAPAARMVKTLLVVSTNHGAGRTTVAHNMAVTLARSGRSVSLIEFPEGTDDGWSSNSRHFDASIVAPADRVSGNGHAPAGPGDGEPNVIVNPAEFPALTEGANLKSWLRSFELSSSRTDVLLIDAGPLRDRSTAVAFAQAVDAIVLVVPIPHEQLDELGMEIRSSLATSDAVLIPVLNRPPRPRSRLHPVTAGV